MKKKTPPPVGIKPLWLHNEARLTEIREASERYRKAGLRIPREWNEEAEDLTRKIKYREYYKQTLKPIIWMISLHYFNPY